MPGGQVRTRQRAAERRRRARRSGRTAAPDGGDWQGKPRRRACDRATGHWRGCGRSPHRQSLRQAPVRPRGSQASAAISPFSRTSSLLLMRPLHAARDSFGRRFWSFKNERREERGLPSSPFWSRSGLLDLVRAAPLWERSLYDRSYASLPLIGITWTYLRPSLPSRNATWPSVSAKRVWSLPKPTLSPGCHLV